MILVKSVTNASNALNILNSIPEFSGNFTAEILNTRLNSIHLIIVAYIGNKPVGCKIAYDRFSDGSFYSWLGGVIPEHRKKGIAHKLNSEMERLVKEKAYSSIVFKTRNKFKSMLQFGLKNGYHIIGFEEKDPISESRIILKKEL